LADARQFPHCAVPLKQAQLGVAPQAVGRSWHAYEPGFVMAPPIIASQYCEPCVQKYGPHANSPAGAVHPPAAEMSWPEPFASHSLL
jgi:hypothetical protein